jgi:hypothetical protein
MENRIQQYKWLYEGLWIIAALVITLAAVMDIRDYVQVYFFWYIAGCCFFAFTYLRWIIFPLHSPIMFSFWFKTAMIFFNIPIFLFVTRYFTAAMGVFDSFNFSYEDRDGQYLTKEIPFEAFDYIKTLTIFSASTMLISIVLFELRSIQLIFKWRQVPQTMTS